MNGILKSEWIDEECFESFQAAKERIDENGRKLPHDFEARRSMKILRDLERKYNLHPSIKRQEQTGREGLRKVNYPAGNVKQQVSSVVRSCLHNSNAPPMGSCARCWSGSMSLSRSGREPLTGEVMPASSMEP